MNRFVEQDLDWLAPAHASADAWEQTKEGNWEFVRSKRAASRLEAEFEGELVAAQTAGDDRVCDICDDIADNSPYELDEAMDLLPAHIGCRCAIVEWTGQTEDTAAPPVWFEAPVQDAWSEEARAAALEARRANAKGKEAKSGTKKEGSGKKEGAKKESSEKKESAEHKGTSEFKEEEHPRGEHGKWINAGGGADKAVDMSQALGLVKGTTEERSQIYRELEGTKDQAGKEKLHTLALASVTKEKESAEKAGDSKRVESLQREQNLLEGKVGTAGKSASAPEAKDLELDKRVATQESLNKFQEHTIQRSKMSEEQQESLSDYSGAEYENINNSLRSGGDGGSTKSEGTDRTGRETVKQMDLAMSQASTPYQVTTYRAVEPDLYAKIEKLTGSVFEDKGFVSVTGDPSSLDDMFESAKLMRVIIPKGTRAIPMSEELAPDKQEQEIILDRGTRFTVEKSRGMLTLRVAGQRKRT